MASRPQATTALALLRRQFQLAQVPRPRLPGTIRDIAKELLGILKRVGVRDFLDTSRFLDLPKDVEARRIKEEAKIRATVDRILTLGLTSLALFRAAERRGGLTDQEDQQIITLENEIFDLEFSLRILDRQLTNEIERRALGKDGANALSSRLFFARLDVEDITRSFTFLVFRRAFNLEEVLNLRRQREKTIAEYLKVRQGVFRFLPPSEERR